MVFKSIKEPIRTSEPYYDLFDGGYIKPEKLLKHKDEAKKVNEAVALVKRFLEDAEEFGLIEVQ